MSPTWAGCDLRGGVAPGTETWAAHSQMEKSPGFPASSMGSGVGGEQSGCFQVGGVCQAEGSPVFLLSPRMQTFLKSVWIFVETSFLTFSPLVSPATPKQTHTAMSPGSQLHFPADT